MRNNKHVIVVIVNFYSGAINSLVELLSRNGVEVIVSNNGGGLEKVRKLDHVRVVDNRRNVGYAAACNVGVKLALERGARRLVILNPDVSIKFKDLIGLIQSGYDISAPIIYFYKKSRLFYDCGGRVNWVIGRPSHVEFTNRRRRDLGIDFVSGAVMCIKSTVFERIGMFDETFFLYFEDVDFCRRAIRAGFSLGVVRKIVVKHMLGEVAGQNSWVKHYNNLRSNFIFIFKHVVWLFKPVAVCYCVLLSVWVAVKFLVGKIV